MKEFSQNDFSRCQSPADPINLFVMGSDITYISVLCIQLYLTYANCFVIRDQIFALEISLCNSHE